MAIALITYLRFAEIASVFGTTWKTDAFVMAMVLPILARNIVAYTFGSSFMPIFSRVSLNKGAEAANRFTSRIDHQVSAGPSGSRLPSIHDRLQ